jgi:hypothetical protein
MALPLPTLAFSASSGFDAEAALALDTEKPIVAPSAAIVKSIFIMVLQNSSAHSPDVLRTDQMN